MKFIDYEKKSYKNERIKCKRTKLGTICKFKADVVTLPLDKNEFIPINVYTSESFKEEGKYVMNLLNKQNKQINNIFKINQKIIEKEKTPKQVIHIPTIMIGEGDDASVLYGTEFDARLLLINAQQYLNTQKFNL